MRKEGQNVLSPTYGWLRKVKDPLQRITEYSAWKELSQLADYLVLHCIAVLVFIHIHIGI